MADKSISDLIQALQITGEDLFVLEQNGEAKKLKGKTLLDFITLNVVSVTVTTLPAGSSATATYDTSTNTLALGIPQGKKGDTVIETASLGNRAEGTRRFIGLTKKTWYTLRVYASTVKGMVGDLADTISARTLGKTGVTACIGVNGVAKTATPYVVTLVNGVPVWKPYIPKIGI